MTSPNPTPIADELDQLVTLSNLIGRETRLVQPGGGNSSIKTTLPDASGRLVPALLVKGSGTDLRTIGRTGFSRLSLEGLAGLRGVSSMSDHEMMRFMGDCMLGREGPAPSVETPLHSLLPHRVIVHTHDVATMSLTNVKDELAERLVREVFKGEVAYVPYARPGFPLARSVDLIADRIPKGTIGLALAHHGLVIWADDADECHERLMKAIGATEEFLNASRRGRLVLGPPRVGNTASEVRSRAAEAVLPAIRGALGVSERMILHLDDSDEILTTLASERLPELTGRGVATPEHILRAGTRPVWLELDLAAPAEALGMATRTQIAAAHAEYVAYHGRHAAKDEAPLSDWAKVVLVPGLGMVTVFKDKKNAVTANVCYRATLKAIENAEAVDGFRFIPEPEVFEFEHWPLERRKIDEEIERERKTLLLARQRGGRNRGRERDRRSGGACVRRGGCACGGGGPGWGGGGEGGSRGGGEGAGARDRGGGGRAGRRQPAPAVHAHRAGVRRARQPVLHGGPGASVRITHRAHAGRPAEAARRALSRRGDGDLGVRRRSCAGRGWAGASWRRCRRRRWCRARMRRRTAGARRRCCRRSGWRRWSWVGTAFG